jgi:hypothetical protein
VAAGFPDYAFGGRAFTGGQVRAQITAAEDIGTNGWMLWNPTTATRVPTCEWTTESYHPLTDDDLFAGARVERTRTD